MIHLSELVVQVIHHNAVVDVIHLHHVDEAILHHQEEEIHRYVDVMDHHAVETVHRYVEEILHNDDGTVLQQHVETVSFCILINLIHLLFGKYFKPRPIEI